MTPDKGWIYYKHVDLSVNWWIIIADVWTHSDGTHSLQSRSCNATFLQLYSDKETQSNQDIDELEYIFGQTIPLSTQG